MSNGYELSKSRQIYGSLLYKIQRVVLSKTKGVTEFSIIHVIYFFYFIILEMKTSLDWRIPFSVGFVSSFVILFLLVSLKSKFIGLVDNKMFNDFYPIFVILIVINCAIATYTVSLYYYRTVKPGLKGPRGNYGARGEPGEDKKCDITSHKIKRFRFKKIPNPEKYTIDVSVLENATLDLDKARIIPQWSTHNQRGVTDVSKSIWG